ncbi:hypothetical protein [Pseudomonas putida]|uniref:hypothetical protein n=1 Tax=Pseudomonas putida TaxID=303 RepID=UPI002363C7AC|nr:hypothetical protein [Pseudomonas putida]MDD1989978.1 hypothetical protein [Pseudomonas putida]HDS1796126.1 hypothetical protein [Pseudomonas putida]
MSWDTRERIGGITVRLIIGDGLDELRGKIAEATVVVPDWHVGSDNWLEHVLKGLWPQFIALRDEISSDEARSTEEACGKYEDWRARLKCLNPDAPDLEIEKEAKKRSGIDKRPDERIFHRCSWRIMPLYTEVAILSAALCEAEINLALAWGLSMLDKEDVFQLIESKSTPDKWLHGPKAILPAYEMPKGCAEVETLRKVFSERNRLVHPKSSIRKAGQQMLGPKESPPVRLRDLIVWIERFFSLPFDLADYLRTQPLINGSRFPAMSFRDVIDRAPQHKLPQPPKPSVGTAITSP